MKTNLIPILMVLLGLHMFNLSAQTDIDVPEENGGEYPTGINDAKNPCISPEQYKEIEQRCNGNALLFISDAPSKASVLPAVPLNWPLKAAAGFTDCSYYFISAHVDQDNAPTTFHDYNCGTITYDGHKGTDIAIEPFPFYKMDNNQVEVIAAAAGTIIDKHDGEYDKNCVGAGSGLIANYVVVQHANGSRALYWHMKKNSLTGKAIGQTVAAGEYLGVVGSSGSSSGPHLHFEIWAGNTSSTVNDPFSGTCNILNASTWWVSQKPYTEPEVLKASVHTTDLTLPACPLTETLNESTSYTIPFQGAGLAPGYAKFYIFLRNETSGTTVNMSILNPNSTVFNSWTRNCVNNYNYSYWGYSKLLPVTPGTYTFQATYNGITCAQSFTIQSVTGISETNDNLKSLRIYPNPFHSVATIVWNRTILDGTLHISNEYGQNIRTIKSISGQEIKLDRRDLPGGVYFIRLTQDNALIGTEKMIITN